MDFAPYQDQNPETVRALSPPPAGRTKSASPSPRSSLEQARRQNQTRNIGTAAVASPRESSFAGVAQDSYFVGQPHQQQQPYRGRTGDNGGVGSGEERGWGNPLGSPGADGARSGWGAGLLGGSGREDVDLFETSLGIRLDYEACLAYLILPPAGGVLLLMLEHRSDYVR
jgi:hypothetical protein